MAPSNPYTCVQKIWIRKILVLEMFKYKYIYFHKIHKDPWQGIQKKTKRHFQQTIAVAEKNGSLNTENQLPGSGWKARHADLQKEKKKTEEIKKKRRKKQPHLQLHCQFQLPRLLGPTRIFTSVFLTWIHPKVLLFISGWFVAGVGGWVVCRNCINSKHVTTLNHECRQLNCQNPTQPKPSRSWFDHIMGSNPPLPTQGKLCVVVVQAVKAENKIENYQNRKNRKLPK